MGQEPLKAFMLKNASMLACCFVLARAHEGVRTHVYMHMTPCSGFGLEVVEAIVCPMKVAGGMPCYTYAMYIQKVEDRRSCKVGWF